MNNNRVVPEISPERSDAVFDELLATQIENNCYNPVTLKFFDIEMRKKYSDFNKINQSYTFMTFFIFCDLAWLVAYLLFYIFVKLKLSDTIGIIWFVIGIITLAMDLVYFAVLTLRKVDGVGTNYESVLLHSLIVSRQITYGVYLLFLAGAENCDSNPWNFDVLLCNSMAKSNGLPVNLSFLLTIYPLLARIIFRQLHWEYIILIWAISVASFSAALVIVGAPNAYYHYLFTSSVVLIGCLYQNEKQNLKSFLTTLKLCSFVATKESDAEKNAEKAKITEMKSMLGNVAHDLKTPLASLLNGIEIVIRETKSLHKYDGGQVNGDAETCDMDMKNTREEAGEGLKVDAGAPPLDVVIGERNKTLTVNTVDFMIATLKNMDHSGRFMTMAINRCIDYTKATNGIMLRPNLETTTIMNILNLPVNCVRDLQTKIDIEIETIPDNIPSIIVTDVHWLQENMLCLLSNAVKYSNQGTIVIRVYKSLAHGGTGLQFEVEDTGVGLSEEAMPTLFQPFKKAQRMSSGGTGLGLFSLSKRMEALNGKYGVMKRRDGKEGCLFWFSIPYFPAENDGLCPKSEMRMVSSTNSLSMMKEYKEGSDKGLKILLVDDSMMIIKMTSNLLRRHGHTVVSAINGVEALQIITDSRDFDICIMDFQMPVLDGFETTERIRKVEAKRWMDEQEAWEGTEESVKGIVSSNYEKLYVIGCSANCENDVTQEAYQCGMDDFIRKPLSINSLNESIQRRKDKMSKVLVWL